MSKAKAADLPPFLASSVSITCPNSNSAVGPSFSVCGDFNPSYFCPEYRVRVRIYYKDANGVAQIIDAMVDGSENPNRYSYPAVLSPAPGPNELVVVTAQLYNNTGGALSGVVSVTTTFDPTLTTDVCSGTCGHSHRRGKRSATGATRR